MRYFIRNYIKNAFSITNILKVFTLLQVKRHMHAPYTLTVTNIVFSRLKFYSARTYVKDYLQVFIFDVYTVVCALPNIDMGQFLLFSQHSKVLK